MNTARDPGKTNMSKNLVKIHEILSFDKLIHFLEMATKNLCCEHFTPYLFTVKYDKKKQQQTKVVQY